MDIDKLKKKMEKLVIVNKEQLEKMKEYIKFIEKQVDKEKEKK